MLNIIYSPRWFFPGDVIIDFFSMIVLLLIAFFSFEYYKVRKKNKNYLWLTVSFTVLAISFLFKIITNFTVYKKAVNTETIGLLTVTYQHILSSDILTHVGFLGFRVLMILGLLILFSIYNKRTSKQELFILTYLILAITFLSRAQYFIFHLTSIFLLLLITSKLYENYKRNKQTNSNLLFYSFAVIILSQLFYMLIEFYMFFYILGEVIQLVGYFILLITFVRIIKYGKKKQNRHN